VVLRSGAKVGPAGGWDKAGAAAGVGAVAVLLTFVVWAGTREGYSHVDDSISQLGARGTSGRWWTYRRVAPKQRSPRCGQIAVRG